MAKLVVLSIAIHSRRGQARLFFYRYRQNQYFSNITFCQ